MESKYRIFAQYFDPTISKKSRSELKNKIHPNVCTDILQDGSRKISSNPNNGSRKHLTSYYESLRSNVMSILGHVKVPSASDDVMHASGSKDNFDSYLTKLQSICTETMTNEEVKPITGSSGGGNGSQVKP